MVKVEIVKATQEHIDYMKPRLRESEVKYCWAMAHMSAEEGLQNSFDRSSLCWTALVNGCPTLCWGISGRTILRSSCGRPWLAATNDISKIGFRFG